MFDWRMSRSNFYPAKVDLSDAEVSAAPDGHDGVVLKLSETEDSQFLLRVKSHELMVLRDGTYEYRHQHQEEDRYDHEEVCGRRC